ncbi:unnamed protein product [Auanema sp. JU1783]|nr:unnamed protein product [Auanema sp. JU1783]
MADSAANEAPASAPAAECQGTPKRNLNTQQRLFGADDAKPTPKRNTPTYKSSIFSEETPASPQRTPKRTIPTLARNPITGEIKTIQPSQSQQQISV